MNQKMKCQLQWLAAILLVLLTSVVCQAQVVDAIAAVVNGKVVTKSEIDRELTQLGAPTDDENLKKEVLEGIIERILVEERAQKMKLALSDEDVKFAVKSVASQYNLDEAGFKAAVTKRGISWDAYLAGIKNELLRVRVFSLVMGEELKLDDNRLKDYYLKNADLFRLPPKVRLLHATAPAGSGLMLLLKKRIIEGTDFRKAAVDILGDEPYDTGTLDLGALNETFRDAIMKTDVGQISPLISTPEGDHMVLVLEKTPGTLLPFEQVKDRVREHFTSAGAVELYRNWIDQVKRKANIQRMN